jgi:hypothetical protein
LLKKHFKLVKKLMFAAFLSVMFGRFAFPLLVTGLSLLLVWVLLGKSIRECMRCVGGCYKFAKRRGMRKAMEELLDGKSHFAREFDDPDKHAEILERWKDLTDILVKAHMIAGKTKEDFEVWSLPKLFGHLILKFHPFPKIWLLPPKDDFGLMACAQGMAVCGAAFFCALFFGGFSNGDMKPAGCGGLPQFIKMAVGMFIGMFIGSYVFGVASDKFGRRKVFLASAAWVAACGIFSALSVNYAMLLIGQLLVGVGIGGVPVAFSLFTEFLPAESRGKQLVVLQCFWTVGVLLEAAIAWVVMPKLGWRWLLIISSIPNALLVTQACLVPESPRYLGLRGDSDGAMLELQKAADYNGASLPPGKLRVRAVNAEEQEVTVMDLFRHGQAELTIFIWALWFLVTLLYYGIILLTTEVFQSGEDEFHKCVKLTANDYRDVFITSCAEIPSLVAALFMVDYFGRRVTLMVAFFGMACALILLILVADSRTGQGVMLFGSRGCANLAFTVIYIGTAEMYPTIYRTTGLGSASAMARIGGFAAPYIAQVMYDASSTIAVLSMASLAFLASYVAKLLPEVAGSLKDSLTPRSSGSNAEH